jgi:chromate transporter
MEPGNRSNLGEVARLFLKLDRIAFGGPAARIALMLDEVVQHRQWITEQEFPDLLGATNPIPGPNSTEMAIHLGFKRAGWRGLGIAGVCFIVPAMLIHVYRLFCSRQMVAGLALGRGAIGLLSRALGTGLGSM